MTSNALIARDTAALEATLRPLAEPGRAYAILDFPNYSNVGDSAIWLGEVKLLERLFGAEPAYVATTQDFDAERMQAVLGDGIVFLQGGGNFGDIYERHQTFREMILTRFPRLRVVQLPQSIGYRGTDGIRRTAAAIRSHPDFHLLVRDARSRDLAMNEFGCATHLTPDAAFAIGPVARAPAGGADVVFLLRRDVEKVERDDAPFAAVPNATTVDWVGEPRDYAARHRRPAALAALLSGRWSPERRRYVLYNRLAQDRFRRGLRLLSGASAVVTDRLHAHIISVLLGLPHVTLDNDYGKIGAYMAQWTKDLPNVRSATTPSEALARLGELRAAA